ncbi:MAG: type VII secretion protein EccB [Mycobacterium sp.]
MTRLQVSGYRFLTRRMEYALTCRDTRMLDDPIRGQSAALAAGVVVAAIVVVVCAVLALLRPHGTLGTDPIVMVRESGAVYVRVGDTMHPALNLASARLIARTPATPRLVSAAMIANAKRGPLVGIPGAPEVIAPAPAADLQTWTVCDDTADRTTTLVIGPAAAQMPAPVMLVTAAHGSGTYVLHAGRRAAVDLRDRVVMRALRLDGVVPLEVSAPLLDALPDTTPVGAPAIPDAGRPGPGVLRNFRVGEVLRVQRADGFDQYVVLAGGVQRVGSVAADLIRFADSRGGGTIPEVPADLIAQVPVVDVLRMPDLAEAIPVGAGFADVLCARWTGQNTGQIPETAVVSAHTVPGQGHTVELAQSDGPGPGIDAVSVPQGRSVYVRAAGVAGEGRPTGPRYLVTAAGVAFGVADTQAAVALGLPTLPGSAPWPVLAVLPRGPELSVESASVLRDSVVVGGGVGSAP